MIRLFLARSVLGVALLAPVGLVQPLSAAEAPATLADAVATLQSGDAPGAAKMLEAITEREPENAHAWSLLGTLYKGGKQLDKAAAAYQHAMEVDPTRPNPLYSLAAVAALRGQKDEAFQWLTKAKATGKADLTGLSQDDDFAAIMDDKRFAGFVPKADDFADPFVEQVKVIREFDGEAANDQFGWIARKLGDADGDGVTDFVTSAPNHASGGKDAGRVYVYSTGTGKLLWQADGKAGDILGTGVECAGDTNGDGIPDVIASGPPNGVAYIYSGKDGRILQSLKSSSKTPEAFGQHVAGVGDVNHDGCADVIIGAPPPPGKPGKGMGHAYVYSGKDGKTLLTLTGESEGDRFGNAVAGYSDGKQMFLVVGAPKAGPEKHGRVFVYTGLTKKARFTFDGDSTASAYGAMFLSVIGDTDGDGTPDIYVSDWPNNAKGPSTGRVYVYSGKDGHPLLTLTGEHEGGGLGTSPSPAGDVDHDGHDDLIVGAWQYAGGATSGGRGYLFSGKDGSLMKTYTCRTAGDTFGFDAVGMGDVDHDGTVDFLITSGWSGIHGYHSGRVFLISSGVTPEKAK
ncbi:MAG TPA: FG-GAP-like repeat-containing protein [Chthoniobacterales bacterium]|jgi:hypothetical protein